jgi:hypothetical protein
MLLLAVLGAALLAIWLAGVWWRGDKAAFMADWVHVLLVAAVIVLLMAAGMFVERHI